MDNKGKLLLVAGGFLTEVNTATSIYYFLDHTKEARPMKLLSTYQVAEVTGLPYAKALFLIKSMNHIQMGNRYYVSETTLRAFLNPTTPILIKEEN